MWRQHKIPSRARHRSPKGTYPAPDRQACKNFEKKLSSLETNLEHVVDQVLIRQYASLFVSPSGKIYGSPGYNHDNLARQAGAVGPIRFQEAGFLRVYVSGFNDLAFHVVTKPTKQQLEVMEQLNDVLPGRDFVILANNNSYTLQSFKETL